MGKDVWTVESEIDGVYNALMAALPSDMRAWAETREKLLRHVLKQKLEAGVARKLEPVAAPVVTLLPSVSSEVIPGLRPEVVAILTEGTGYRPGMEKEPFTTASRMVPVETLPALVQSSLAQVNYVQPSIRVSTDTTFSFFTPGWAGKQAFATVVNLALQRSIHLTGTWGGALPWNKTKLVDSDRTEYPLPPQVAVINGTMGGREPTDAWIFVHPSTEEVRP